MLKKNKYCRNYKVVSIVGKKLRERFLRKGSKHGNDLN